MAEGLLSKEDVRKLAAGTGVVLSHLNNNDYSSSRADEAKKHFSDPAAIANDLKE
jgi:hypothetical protein